MNKILLFLNHPFVKLIFDKLKEVFGSKEFKELTVVEPITEEVVVKEIVTPKTVVSKKVASKPVVKKSTKKKPTKH